MLFGGGVGEVATPNTTTAQAIKLETRPRCIAGSSLAEQPRQANRFGSGAETTAGPQIMIVVGSLDRGVIATCVDTARASCGVEHYNSSSDTARNTASIRVPTSSFKKICLTCDFTVSGEISRVRAMRLLEQP